MEAEAAREAAEARARAAEAATEELKSLRSAADSGALTPELEEMVLASSQRAVTAAERAKSFASKLHDEQAGRRRAEEQLGALRADLVRGVAGASADVTLYQNAPLADLLRLFGKEKSEAAASDALAGSRPMSRSSRPGSRATSRGGARRQAAASPSAFEEPLTDQTDLRDGTDRSEQDRAASSDGRDDDGDDDGFGGSGLLDGDGPGARVAASMDHEAAIKAARKHNLALSRRLSEAAEREERLMQAANETHDAKARAASFASKLRAVKGRATRAEKAAEAAEDRVDALSKHIAKLMTHLEHEAGAKAKLHDKLRKAEAAISRLKARNGKLASANQQRDRLVLELKEGAKILEDQLRLMDQKYVELRGKLDWLRGRADKEVKRARKQAEVVERAWLDLQASGIIPISRKPPKMPAAKLMVGDPPGMPGADVAPLDDGPGAAAASATSLPSIGGSRAHA